MPTLVHRSCVSFHFALSFVAPLCGEWPQCQLIYGGGCDSDEGLSDDEEDPELLSLTEDAGSVRNLTVNDRARIRILDGHWYSPADQYFGNRIPDRPTVVPAVHQCPWTIEDVSI